MRTGLISSISGTPVSSLGLAAHPEQEAGCVWPAFEAGVNFFFLYSPGYKAFVGELGSLARGRRQEMILASGSGSRTAGGLRSARRKILSELGVEVLDIFFAEYIHPADDLEVVFGEKGVLDELARWKAGGWIRYVGRSAHDRTLAKRLAEDPRVDVLMHRFNMAHRKAAAEVFPAALASQTSVVAFTATRWGTLLKPRVEWRGEPPTAGDCYRYCLAQPAIGVTLTAPKSVAELAENLSVLKLPPMDEANCDRWERFGDLVYQQGDDEFESRWP